MNQLTSLFLAAFGLLLLIAAMQPGHPVARTPAPPAAILPDRLRLSKKVQHPSNPEPKRRKDS
jgi:hypothetical protein